MRSNELSSSKAERSIIDKILLLLIPLGFIVSDWMIGPFSFGDIIFGILITGLLVSKNIYLNRKDYFLLASLLLYLLILYYIAPRFNPIFVFKSARAANVKIMFFTLTALLSYRFIRKKELEKDLIKLLNYTSIFIIVVGIYMTIAIYTDALPYEFIWSFTRSDKASYLFRETIRMRSFFSEPAHLGFFLNTILGLNFFSDYRTKYNVLINSLLLFGVLLTFSYSSISISVVFVFIKLCILIKNGDILQLDVRLWLVLGFIASFIIIYFSGEYIYRTFILRTLLILQGEDGSAIHRFFGSWDYITRETMFFGNGAGNTPPITNNFAYMFSDLGLFTFIISIIFTGYIVWNNIGLGIVFIILNFQKGGYLSPTFPILVLLIMIYTIHSKKNKVNKFTLN